MCSIVPLSVTVQSCVEILLIKPFYTYIVLRFKKIWCSAATNERASQYSGTNVSTETSNCE